MPSFRSFVASTQLANIALTSTSALLYYCDSRGPHISFSSTVFFWNPQCLPHISFYAHNNAFRLLLLPPLQVHLRDCIVWHCSLHNIPSGMPLCNTHDTSLYFRTFLLQNGCLCMPHPPPLHRGACSMSCVGNGVFF